MKATTNTRKHESPFDTILVRLISRCDVIRIHVALFDRERTSLPKHYEALVAGTTARDVFITLQKRLSPERKPCSGKKVFEEEESRRLKVSGTAWTRTRTRTRTRMRTRTTSTAIGARSRQDRLELSDGKFKFRRNHPTIGW
ncbi:hypothetical protein DBV15_02218 [Temnothorax longispinosus]|uniref:Uncharacterized protein n=1 Tax=Temnothorax longispinosus TaxID=300112 RepID=A0A4S2KNW5_9HYME|nr:hypothetical protein DBV15_02218 [Temnothorax longispinosus]